MKKNEHLETVKKQLPSSNQTWLENHPGIDVFFPLDPPFHWGIGPPCFMTPEGFPVPFRFPQKGVPCSSPMQ
jgi:hypothetical protein